MGKARKIPSAEINLPKTIAVILSVYVFAIICFYFLAGDQIRFRESRGNITMQPIQGVAAELSAGITIEQLFYAPIQRLESVSVQWGIYYRTNAGTVYMDLIRQDTGETIMSGAFDVSTLGEHEVLTLSAPTPIETINKTPLILRLTSDSEPGSSVAPLTNLTPNEGFYLFVNGQLVDGMLCFSASGTDNIWTGFHYWEFAAGLGGLQILFFTIVWLRWRSGKRSYIVNASIAIKKYRFLIRQLVARDFKTKYKRSLLGVFWSFLNPLLMMLVQYFVFSTIFRNDIPFFAAYLIIGTVMFNFLSESCGMTLSSILGNAGLITKVYMPKYIYPLTRTMSSVVNLAISLIPMTLVCLGAGRRRSSPCFSLYASSFSAWDWACCWRRPWCFSGTPSSSGTW